MTETVSFAELEQKESVTTAEVTAVLQEYAESGAAIIGRVVIDLIGKARPNVREKIVLIKHARTGMEMQGRVCRTPASRNKNVGEYQQVLTYLMKS
jgi:hypothetical protein